MPHKLEFKGLLRTILFQELSLPHDNRLVCFLLVWLPGALGLHYH